MHASKVLVNIKVIRELFIYLFYVFTAKYFIYNVGYTIPKGWNVIVWLRNVHTDPKNFDHPLCFDPDRWNVSLIF